MSSPQFVKKKFSALDEVCKTLREVNNAQSSLVCFGDVCLYNKINHLLRTCPPELLQDALAMFDAQFQSMVAEVLRVPCLSEDQWEQASLPVKLAGLGVNQTKVVAGSAYVGSCALTRDLVAALLNVESYEPTGVSELLSAHEVVTGASHDFESLSTASSVYSSCSPLNDMQLCTRGCEQRQACAHRI